MLRKTWAILVCFGRFLFFTFPDFLCQDKIYIVAHIMNNFLQVDEEENRERVTLVFEQVNFYLSYYMLYD